jgi:hypothetical protein
LGMSQSRICMHTAQPGAVAGVALATSFQECDDPNEDH